MRSYYGGPHEEVSIPKPDGTSVLVDEKLVQLIQLLWARDIETLNSCEGFPKFVDQTERDATRYRGFITMIRNSSSLEFITELLQDFYAFRADKVLWSIDFERLPRSGRHTIKIHFPHWDIEKLVDFLEMAKERELFLQQKIENYQDVAIAEFMKEKRDDS